MADLVAKRYRSIEAANENAWNNAVTQSTRGTVFHRYEWLRAAERAFDWEPRHVVVEKSGSPIGLLPNFETDLPLPESLTERLPFAPPFRRLVSTPEAHGGPLVLADEDETLELLFDELEWGIGPRVVAHVIETYDLTSVRYGQYLETRGYVPSFDSCFFLLDLRRGWEALLDGMAKDRRRQFRKAREQDARVTVDPLDEDLETTYDWYVKNLERVGGSPLPRRFLEELADALGDRLRVYRAFVEGAEVGRNVFLRDEEGGVLHAWLTAIPDEANYEYRPTELIDERAIKRGIERGFDGYSLGKTGAHYANSVFAYKSGYGASVHPLFRVEKGHSRLAWPLYRFGRTRQLRRSM